MERTLPIINVEGTDFRVDVEQMALIGKDNTGNRINFYDMVDMGTHYEIEYDPKLKNISDGPDDNYVTVDIPSMTRLDPEGMAQKYHASLENIAQRTDEDVMTGSPDIQQRLAGKLNLIEIEGHPFYVDFMMGYLRPHDDFSTHGISLETLDYAEADGIYGSVHLYDPKKHELYEPDMSTITSLPEGIKLIRLPPLMQLDPLGYARKFNWELKEVLLRYDFQAVMKAKTLPIEQSILPKIMNENKLRLAKTDAVQRKGRKL